MNLRPWLQPRSPEQPDVITDPIERRAIGIEITIVLVLTFGLSAMSSILSLIEKATSERGISGSSVALNVSSSDLDVIDFFRQLLSATKLFGIAALAVYLIWRAGVPLARIGLPKIRAKFDIPLGAGLAALIGIPGLGLYVIARAMDLNVAVVPSDLNETFWRLPMLVFSAIANSAAEELLVVAYLITRLRQLGWTENRSLLFSAVLRGGYHLYQGIGAGLGNVLMGLVYGRVFQKTNRVWPLIIGHALIDTVAFVGYALLKDHLSWLD